MYNNSVIVKKKMIIRSKPRTVKGSIGLLAICLLELKLRREYKKQAMEAVQAAPAPGH